MLKYQAFTSDDVLLLTWNEKGMVKQITSSETYSRVGSISSISVIKDPKMGYVAKIPALSTPIIQVGTEVESRPSSITLEAWFKWNGASSYSTTVIVGLATLYNTDGGLIICLYNDNIYFASDECFTNFPHAQIKANEWVHLALCYDGTIYGFINGKLIGTYSVSVKYSKPYWVGSYHTWSSSSYYYRGSEQLAYVRITKKVKWRSSFDINKYYKFSFLTVKSRINYLSRFLVICFMQVMH